MRLYHFLAAQYALDDIRARRLKLSKIETLNDPFELWYPEQSDRNLRNALRAWKSEMSQQFGLICFSAAWRDPLLWSHYADKHKGICLGFDVHKRYAKEVDYVDSRLPLKLPLSEASTQPLLFTKYSGWSYEREWRVWFKLRESDPVTPDHYFRKFDKFIRLREVIAGPLCKTPGEAIHKVLGRYADSVAIVKSRLAFGSFEVVKDQRGFRK